MKFHHDRHMVTAASCQKPNIQAVMPVGDVLLHDIARPTTMNLSRKPLIYCPLKNIFCNLKESLGGKQYENTEDKKEHVHKLLMDKECLRI